MKVFLVSKKGGGLPLLYKLSAEGHEVQAFVKDKVADELWSGLIDRSPLRAGVTWADLVLFDSPGAGRMADELREKGIPVFGGGRKAEQLEAEAPEALFASNSMDEVEKFVKRNTALYRLRSEDLDYFAGSPEEMRRMIPYIKRFVSPNAEIALYEREFAKVVYASFFVSKGRLARPIYLSTSDDESFAGFARVGRLPISGGLVGKIEFDVVLIVEGLVQDVVTKLGPDYSGFVNLQTCVIDNVPKLEHVATGLDSLPACCAFDHLGPELGRTLFEAASGTLKEVKAVRQCSFAGTELYVPGEENEQPVYKGLPIIGVRRFDLQHVWMFDMVPDKLGDPITGGTDARVLSVTWVGDTTWSATHRMTELCDSIRVPQAGYKSKVTERLADKASRIFEGPTLNEQVYVGGPPSITADVDFIENKIVGKTHAVPPPSLLSTTSDDNSGAN